MNEILDQLDRLFLEKRLDEVEPFLLRRLEETKIREEWNLSLGILNEMIGFFRDTSQYDKSITYSTEAISLAKDLGLEGTVPFATTILNVANALRAAGQYQQSKLFHERALEIYLVELDTNDERIASVYNNMSLLYQEMGEFEQAILSLKQALSIIELQGDNIKLAITHSNLGSSYINLGQVVAAKWHLKQAKNLFDLDEEKDFHYSACMSAMAQVCVVEKKYKQAKKYYEIALEEQKKHCGESEFYYRILDNIGMVEHQIGTLPKGMDLCRSYVEEIAYPDFEKKYPYLIGRVAFGLVGEGSDCLGFDDEWSMDHDFGPGFCLFLEQDDFEIYGSELQEWYEGLEKEYKGFIRTSINGTHRLGVQAIESYFEYYTNSKTASDYIEKNRNNIINLRHEMLSAFFAGEMFRDPLGIFQGRRQAFAQVFEEELRDFWVIEQIKALREMAQAGQYNYPRLLERNDLVSAHMAKTRFAEACLKYIHYREHKFPPIYKWLKRSASEIQQWEEVVSLLEQWMNSEESTKEVDLIASYVISELSKDLDFVVIEKGEFFLEHYAEEYLQYFLLQAEKMVEEVIELEWKAFDQVENMGGRASCQNDYGTFLIMRKSQYLSWPKPLLYSYLDDFHKANERGWNLMTEKYGRMMEHTDPNHYKNLEPYFRKHTKRDRDLVDQLVEIQVAWMESFAIEYPCMAGNARLIRSSQDTLLETSYETYLRGELMTYSQRTLKRYGKFILELVQSEGNLAKVIMTQTALLYGYESLEDAERKLSK